MLEIRDLSLKHATELFRMVNFRVHAYQSPLPTVFLADVPSPVPLEAAAEAKVVGVCEGILRPVEWDETERRCLRAGVGAAGGEALAVGNGR